MKHKKPKAIALISGGLDSALVLKILKEQGIDLLALNFYFPVSTGSKTKTFAQEFAESLEIKYLSIPLGRDYIEIVKKPKHGHGKGINPCIDCKIYMLKKARALMNKHKASFIATGEVLGQRPMSQHWRALQIIEAEAGLKGKVLRPLSAKLLPITEPEKKGWVDRQNLLDIQGRSRKAQFFLAEELGIKGYSSPAGGCFLTGVEFASKLYDLFRYQGKATWHDIRLLRVGRHFRFKNNKIIVGRNKDENDILQKYKHRSDYVLEAKDWMGPITLLQGEKGKESIEFAAGLTILYSDCDKEEAFVNYGRRKIKALALSQNEANNFNLTLKSQ